MAPDQWTKRAAEGVQGLGSEFNRLIGKGLGSPQVGKGFVLLYSLMFGLGLLLAAFATTIATKDIAKKGVTARETAIHAYSRLIFYVPLMAAVPFAVSLLYDLANGTAVGFLEYGRAELMSSITWVVSTLGAATIAAPVVPGGMLVLLGLCLCLVCSLFAILVEIAIAQLLVYLLALLIPIIFAASINPRWHGGMKKLIGGLIGALLTPTAMALMWAVFASTLNGGGVTEDGVLQRMLLIVAALVASVGAPLVVGIVLAYVIPAFAEWHDSDRRSARYALASTAATARSLGRSAGREQAKALRASKAQNASSATKGTLPVDSAKGVAGAGGTGGAAAGAGAVGLAVGAAVEVVKQTKRAGDQVRDQAGRSAQRQTSHSGDAPRTGSPGGGDNPRPSQPAGEHRQTAPDTAAVNGPGRDAQQPFTPRQRAGTGNDTRGKDRPR